MKRTLNGIYEIEILERDGQWRRQRPPMPDGAPPYRYPSKLDAQMALNNCYGHVEGRHKRIVISEEMHDTEQHHE